MGLEEAEDLIELGIEGIDTLVEKHFHKLPDKLVDPRTYTNAVRKKMHREKGRKGSGDADGDGDGGRRRGSEDFDGDDRRRRSGDFDDREGERMRRRDDELVRAEDPMRGGGGRERRRDSRREWERGALADAAMGAGAGYEYDRRDRDRDGEYTTRRNSSPIPIDPRSSRSSYGYDPRPPSASASYSTPPQGYEYMVPPVPPAAAVYNYGNPQQAPRYVNLNENQNGRFQTAWDPSGYNYLPPQRVRRGSSLPPGERRNERRGSGDWEGGREGRRKSEDRDRGDGNGNGSGNKSKRRNKSEERDNDNGGPSKTEKVVLTLLGAAVGGLALNAVFERMDKKNDKKRDESDAGRVGGIAVGGRKGRRRTNG